MNYNLIKSNCIKEEKELLDNVKKYFLKQEKQQLVKFILHLTIYDNKVISPNKEICFNNIINNFNHIIKEKSVNTIESYELENKLIKSNIKDITIKTKDVNNTNNNLNILNKVISENAEETKTNKKKQKCIDFNNKIHLAFKFLYIGKQYDGLVYQQDTSNTIEEKILSAFLKCKLIKDIKSCNFSRCGRTDKGVSSFGNVFNLEVRKIDNFDYVKVINKMLPDDIKLIGISNVNFYSFDSRFGCLFREYKYFFVKKNLDLDLMNLAASKLIGEHNFFNFCKLDSSKIDSEGNSTVNYNRRIYEFKLVKETNISSTEKFNNSSIELNGLKDYYDVYYFKIQGSAFLWHQIRCIMSILFLIGRKKEDITIIDELLKENTYHYNYHIAEDYPLILSSCQFEGIEFKCSKEAAKEALFSLSKIFENKKIEYTIYKYMIESFINIVEVDNCINKNWIENITKEYPELNNNIHYTKLLKRKREHF